MSEEILKALMQLFALIVKQDGGMLESEREYVIDFLGKQLSKESVSEYIELFDSFAGPTLETPTYTDDAPPSVKDSVRIFSICKQINRTLNQSQKVVVLMRLYELVNADSRFTLQGMNIINTVAEVFRIASSEVSSIEKFIKQSTGDDPEDQAILVLKPGSTCVACNEPTSEADYLILVLWVQSEDLYFIKHYSANQLFLNGLPLLPGKVYTVANGSSLRYSHGKPIYYSDLSAHFLSRKAFNKISLVAEDLRFSFSDQNTGINGVNLFETEATLVGIMGSSGTGKTTLLNLLCGMRRPDSGTVRINGVDIYDNAEYTEGVIGYVPQDDLLIEDLTVFENLYFAAAFCFKELSEEELGKLVDSTLASLGLLEKRDLRVGSPLNKIISGGQRKRLNIALELIREPSILFLDEPTSGLSSRDSENVMDLLRELTFKGKLVLTVIHQPSSEIYKMFDKIIILDQHGEQVFYGNPVEALIHFKTLAGQIDSNIGECPACGNINPEMIFNILETEVVDEFGRYTGKRKTTPAEWAESFRKIEQPETGKEVDEKPPSNLNRPGPIKQFIIYARRDLMSKISNSQYVMLTLMEAPVLGFILSYIIRYIADPKSNIYIFRENENIPIYIFMSLIVALFLGLISSAEEIFKDRKILKREHFLNLDKNSYLLAKIMVLFTISAIQSFLFVIIANTILGIRGLTFQYWFALFTTATLANVLGLNISNSFNSAITIYIVVPMLMIPMMVLSGAMFPYDKLNRSLGSVEKVPLIAEIMPTKWTYEALMVTQFKENRYDRLVYDMNKQISQAEFNTVFRLPAIKDALNEAVLAYRRKEIDEENQSTLPLLRNEFKKLSLHQGMPLFRGINNLDPGNFNHIVAEEASNYIDSISTVFNNISNKTDLRKDGFISSQSDELYDLYDRYHNDRLEEIVRKIYEKNKILEYRDNLIQNYEPIYLDPYYDKPPGIRSQFFAPTKNFFGIRLDTFVLNMAVVWSMSFILYLLLYFDVLKRVVEIFIKNHR